MGRTLNTFLTNIQKKSKDQNMTADTVCVYLNGAKQEMKSDYRIPSATRRATIKVFPNVNEYPLPIPSGATETDFDSIADLTEWFEGAESESRFDRVSPSDFARKNVRGWHDNYISPYIRNGQNMLLVDWTPPGCNSAVLNECDDLTSNGTWVASGDANNLSADDQTFLSGAGALNFDITPSSLSAILTNAGMSTVDLEDYENNAYLFCYIYIPSATYITSFTLKWGSSASAYFSKSATTQHNGLAFADGWNLVSFDWNGATETGTVDTTAIDYLQLTMAFSASQVTDTDFRIDKIFASQGKDAYFHYNSKYWVKTSAGVIKESFESGVTTDEFVGNEDEAEALQAKALQNIFEEEVIDDVKADKEEKKYLRIIRNLKSKNPTQEMQKSVQYAKKGIF